jgi:DNA-binding transcriptional ArsR family regulator
MSTSEPLQPDRCARALRALAEPDRLRIIHWLRGNPRNVGELAQLLGKSVASVSHHLAVLRHTGLVQDERRGKFVIYRLHHNVLHGCTGASEVEHLDLGCCRLEIPKG